MGVQIAFPKCVFDWIGLFQECCHCVLCQYSERQGNFCHYAEEFNFPQDVWEYLCNCFYQHGIQMTRMPCQSLIWTKTLIGLQTVTMRVSKPFDHLSFSTEPELKALQEVFGTTCYGSLPMLSKTRRRREDAQVGRHHQCNCPPQDRLSHFEKQCANKV